MRRTLRLSRCLSIGRLFAILGVATNAMAAPENGGERATSRAAASPAAASLADATPGGTTTTTPTATVKSRASITVMERVSLDQAIERAIRRNPTAQSAALEIERADALIRQARAASLPTLNANVNYTHLDADRAFGNRIVAAKDQLNANLVLSVPLVAPGRWAQWSHAKDDARILGLSSDEVRRQLAIAVARSFLSVVSQRRVIEVNERALESAVAHERFATARLAGGIGKRIDAVRASKQVSTTQAAVERSRVALMRSAEALGVLLGEEHPVDVAIEPELEPGPSLALATTQSEQRLDVQVARTRRNALERRFRDSWLDFLPQLTGQFQPFYQTPATLTLPTTGWQAMLMLTLPLYEGGARYGAHDERRVQRDQAELAVADLMRQARSEVRIAFEAQRGAETALAAARSAARLAHDAEEMSLLAYEAGASTNLEVIDAERQARDADSEVAIAEDALRRARLDLLIASGRFPAKSFSSRSKR